MKPVHEMGVAELGRALADRELSSVEATGALLERLSAHAALGTVLASDRDAALQQAKAADARRESGQGETLEFLHGDDVAQFAQALVDVVDVGAPGLAAVMSLDTFLGEWVHVDREKLLRATEQVEVLADWLQKQIYAR